MELPKGIDKLIMITDERQILWYTICLGRKAVVCTTAIELKKDTDYLLGKQDNTK